MMIEFDAEVEAGEDIKLRGWQKLITLVAAALAALTTMVTFLEQSMRFIYVLALPALLILFVILFCHSETVYRRGRCKVDFAEDSMYVCIPAVKGTEHDYMEKISIPYISIKDFETDPSTFLFRIRSKMYCTKWYDPVSGETLLEGFGNERQPIDIRFVNKQDIERMEEFLGQFVRIDVREESKGKASNLAEEKGK